MAKEGVDTPRSTRKMCEKMAATILDQFVESLTVIARQAPDGKVETHQIVDMAREFKSEDSDLITPLQKIAANWLIKVEQDILDQNRKQPFERLVVRRFSHLFPPTESLTEEGSVSRRMITALFSAFEEVAGHKVVLQCHQAGRKIFFELKNTRGKDFKWNHFYNDLGANDLVDDLLIVVAWSFQDFSKQLEWMRKYINLNLEAPEFHAYEGDHVENWRLTDKGLIRILKGLFAEYRTKMKDEDTRKRLKTRYGDKALDSLDHLLDHLYREQGP